METDSLTYKTLRNSSYFFLSYALPIVLAIVVTPFTVHRLGVVEYGIFILVNTINSFLGYVDLGLGTALTKYTAEYHARKDFSALRKLLNSAKTLSYIFGFAGLVISLVIGKWLLPAFHIEMGSLQNIFVVLALSGVTFFLNSIALAPISIVHALQRFDIVAKVGMFTLIVSNLLTVVVLAMNYQLKAIMAVNVLISAIVFLIYRKVAARELPEVKLRMRWDIWEIKKAYRFGLQTFVSNLASTALVFLDRLIIPVFLGPAQLSYYSLSGNVALRAAGVSNSLAPMFLPMASALEGAGEQDKLRSIYIRAFRSLTIMAAGITLGVILFANKILFFWLGAEFAQNGTSILIILAVTYYFVGLYIPLQSLLLGLGKTKFLIRMSVIMVIINLIMLLVLIPSMGIIGAAWAYLVSVLPMIYAFWWVEYRHFNLTDRFNEYLKLYTKLIITAIVAGFVIYFGVLPYTNTLPLLLIFGPASVLLYFLLYYLFGFTDAEDLIIFKSFFTRFILSKFKIINK